MKAITALKITIWASLLLTALILFMGGIIEAVKHPKNMIKEQCDTVRVVVYDTVHVVSPEPVTTTQLTPKVVRLPVVTSEAKKAEAMIDALPAWVYTDSADVAVPVEQKVYTGGNWRAVISGAFVSLDTMEVYNQREVVTVRQPPDKPKRWSLGVGVGYGMTPQGMQPFVGVTLSYALIAF